jgi:hypothetical protein
MPMGQQHPSMMPFLNPMMTGMSHSSMAPQNPYGYTYASPVPSDTRTSTIVGTGSPHAHPGHGLDSMLGAHQIGLRIGMSQGRVRRHFSQVSRGMVGSQRKRVPPIIGTCGEIGGGRIH